MRLVFPLHRSWFVAAIVGILIGQAWVLSAEAGNAGGRVSGHTEGMPPIDGKLCVWWPQGAGNHMECKTFMTGGPNDIAISVPEAFVPVARFDVWVGDGTGPASYKPTYDYQANESCMGHLLTAPAGMALCQSTDQERFGNQVHRFNTTWNTNAAGNGTPGRCEQECQGRP
jgi:hypothetical protein